VYRSKKLDRGTTPKVTKSPKRNEEMGAKKGGKEEKFLKRKKL
jgi:hypothetical protein